VLHRRFLLREWRHRRRCFFFFVPHVALVALCLGAPDGARAWSPRLVRWCYGLALAGAAQESEIPNFKGSYLGRFPLVSADFWTSDHLSGRSRSVDVVFGTRARGTLTLKRR
jgi:hypothetical protein